MIDADSFGTALSTLVIITVITVLFGLAILSDIAMRRREDRVARQDGAQGRVPREGGRAVETEESTEGTGHRGRANGQVPTGRS